jgi:glycerol-3-phosphate acyltransferase PlsX
VATHSIISLDAMSGDLGAEVVVRAANQVLRKNQQIELLLVGDENELQGHVTNIVGDEPRLAIVHASEVVEMSDSPVDAMRKKKDSSMRVAIDLVKEGKAAACVSAGNTGALMGTAKHYRTACERRLIAHARPRRKYSVHSRSFISVRRNGVDRYRGHNRS